MTRGVTSCCRTFQTCESRFGQDFFSRLKLAFEKYHYAVITRAKVTISKTVALFQVQLVETRINTQSLWSFDGEDSSGIFIEFLVVVAPSRYRLQATSCRCIGWKARWSGLPVVAVQRAYAALLELPPASDLGDGSGPELHELLAEVRWHPPIPPDRALMSRFGCTGTFGTSRTQKRRVVKRVCQDLFPDSFTTATHVPKILDRGIR